MKRIPTVLILFLLVFSGFNTFALPQERYTEKNPLNMPEFALDIVIEGGFFGYTVTLSNTGPEQVRGNLTINITTDAMFVIFGETLSKNVDIDLNPIDGIENFNLKPLIGFGSASISITGLFKNGKMEYPINNVTSGYAFVIFILCDETTISLP